MRLNQKPQRKYTQSQYLELQIFNVNLAILLHSKVSITILFNSSQ